ESCEPEKEQRQCHHASRRNSLKDHERAFRNRGRRGDTLAGPWPLVGFTSSRGYHRERMFDVRRRQGWVVVGACSLVMFGVWNSHAGFGVFLPVLASEFGWSRGAISVAPSLNLIIGGLIAFFIGAASDRYGPRLILAVSAVLVGALFALASRIDALWHLY